MKTNVRPAIPAQTSYVLNAAEVKEAIVMYVRLNGGVVSDATTVVMKRVAKNGTSFNTGPVKQEDEATLYVD